MTKTTLLKEPLPGPIAAQVSAAISAKLEEMIADDVRAMAANKPRDRQLYFSLSIPEKTREKIAAGNSAEKTEVLRLVLADIETLFGKEGVDGIFHTWEKLHGKSDSAITARDSLKLPGLRAVLLALKQENRMEAVENIAAAHSQEAARRRTENSGLLKK